MHDDYLLRGIELRYVLTLLLLDTAVPMRVPDLVRALERFGYRVDGRPGKTVSDALRWEVGRGRVVRLGRGRYCGGSMPRQTKSRMRARARRIAAAATRQALQPE